MSKAKRMKAHVQKTTETRQDRHSAQKSDGEENNQLEQLLNVEWGERIDSGKAIARGGKDAGYVPGATPSK